MKVTKYLNSNANHFLVVNKKSVSYDWNPGIEFSASENDANETTAENSSKPEKSEDSKEIGEKDGAEKYSNWQEPSKKNDIGDDESDDEPPDEQPIIKCKRYVHNRISKNFWFLKLCMFVAKPIKLRLSLKVR